MRLQLAYLGKINFNSSESHPSKRCAFLLLTDCKACLYLVRTQRPIQCLQKNRLLPGGCTSMRFSQQVQLLSRTSRGGQITTIWHDTSFPETTAIIIYNLLVSVSQRNCVLIINSLWLLLPGTFCQCAMKRLYNFLLSLISLSLDDKHLLC